MIDCNNIDIKVIDTRDTYIYNGWQGENNETGGHIPNAINFCASWIDQYKNNQAMVSELTRLGIYKNSKVKLYGKESIVVQNKLCELGYEDVCILYGGIDRWIAENEEGRSVEKLSNYHQLIHAKWLHDVIKGKQVSEGALNEYKVFEVGFDTRNDYKESHIPGSFYIDTNDFESLPLWNKIPDERIIDTLGLNGITSETTVILYGKDNMAAARVAIILRYIGIDDVRLLNGGYDAWIMAGLPIEKGINIKTPLALIETESYEKKTLIIDHEQLVKRLKDQDTKLISVRSKAEFDGEISGYSYITNKGKIEGSIHARDINAYRNIDGTMYNYLTIKKEWQQMGINKDSYNIFYCGTSWRASEVIFYALVVGYTNIALYDGGWFEWSSLS